MANLTPKAMIPLGLKHLGTTAMIERVRNRIRPFEGSELRFLVAVSGGPDSLGLLTMLLEELDFPPEQLVICYVEHGIRSNTETDKAVIRRITEKAKVDFRILTVNTPKLAKDQRKSLEAAARELRYEALTREAARAECSMILTGHTLDDSAETVLMKMRSGAPWYEWTGIPARRGRILRPLIDVYRYEIRDYLQDKGLEPAWDETNDDLRFRRNALRAKLKGSPFWTAERIQELAREGARLDRYLAGLRSIAVRLTNCESKQVFTGCHSLAIKQILTYFSRIEFLPVEAAWASLVGTRDRRLSSALRRQISDCVLGSGNQARIELPESILMEKRVDVAWVYPQPNVRIHERVGLGEFEIAELSRKLILSTDAASDFMENDAVVLDYDAVCGSLTLRNRQAGDRIKLKGRPKKKISDLQAEMKLSPLERLRTLVLADDNGPLVILDKFVDERALPKPDCRRLLKVSWIPIHGK